MKFDKWMNNFYVTLVAVGLVIGGAMVGINLEKTKYGLLYRKQVDDQLRPLMARVKALEMRMADMEKKHNE